MGASDNLALDAETFTSLLYLVGWQHHRGIDGTPTGVGLLLGDGYRVDGAVGLPGLRADHRHVGVGFHRLAVDGDACTCGWREGRAVVLEEGIDGVYAVYRCVPSRRTLLLQEPLPHLVDADAILGSEQTHCLDGGYLCGDAVAAPGVAGKRSIVVATHAVLVDGKLARTLQALLGLGITAVEGEHHSALRLVGDGRHVLLLLHDIEQIVDGGGSLAPGECRGVEIACLDIVEAVGRMVLGVTFLHFLHTLCHHSVQCCQCVVQDILRGGLLADDAVEPCQRLCHGGSHIDVACHAFPPCQRTIFVLQVTEATQDRRLGSSQLVGIEVSGQTTHTLGVACAIHEPRGFSQNGLLQTLVLFQHACERLIGALLP